MPEVPTSADAQVARISVRAVVVQSVVRSARLCMPVGVDAYVCRSVCKEVHMFKYLSVCVCVRKMAHYSTSM